MIKQGFLFRALGFCIMLALILSSGCSAENNKNQNTDPQDPERTYPTVIIDAGHGGEDGGAVGANGVYEKDLNLKIAFELGALLEASGINIQFTRTEDVLLYDRNTDYEGRKKALDMAARLSIINEYDNAVFISIHMNSFPQQKYKGLQVYYSENSSSSKNLAELVQAISVKNLQPENTRKIKASGGNIFLLEKTTHPAILIECGFISNEQECELLCQNAYRKRLALCIYTAIITFFDTPQGNR